MHSEIWSEMPQTEKSPSPHNIGKGHRGLLHKTGNITWTELMFKGRDKHEFLSYSHLQRVFIFQQHALYPWCADKGSTTDFPNIYIYKFYCFKNIATQFTNNDKTYKNHCCLQCRRPQFDSWVRKTPWRRSRLSTPVFLGFPGGSNGKESACNAGDLGSILVLGRSPGGGHGNLL